MENNAFDPLSKVLAFGSADIGVCLDKKGDPVPCYTLDNNKGSGSLDFLAYAPTMDLSLYSGKGYEFVAVFNLDSANNGPEELFLMNDYAPTVPEPISLVLLGTGLAGLGLVKRKQ